MRVTRASWQSFSIGHFARFVRPGSTRIASTEPDGVKDVAFRTPDGHIVVVVHNVSGHPRSVGVREGGHSFTATVPADGIATFRWTDRPSAVAQAGAALAAFLRQQ